MSLKITSIGFVGTNPESTPLPGVDYSKNQQEVYEEKRHKASIAVEPEGERKNGAQRQTLRHERIRVCPAMLSGQGAENQIAGCVLGVAGRTVHYNGTSPNAGTAAAFRADSAVTGGGVNGDYKALAYPGAVKRLGGLCGESSEVRIAGLLQCVLLHPKSG